MSRLWENLTFGKERTHQEYFKLPLENMRDSVRLFSYSGSARDQDNKAADEHIKILETWARPAQLLGIASSKEN